MSPNAPLQLTHSRIKLLIADDRWVVREGLKRMIAQCADMKVVGEAATPDDVLERLQPTEVDVILLDAWLGGPKTRGLIREVRRRRATQDRKSTRLNSSHSSISYAVFCLKKKKKKK